MHRPRPPRLVERLGATPRAPPPPGGDLGSNCGSLFSVRDGTWRWRRVPAEVRVPRAVSTSCLHSPYICMCLLVRPASQRCCGMKTVPGPRGGRLKLWNFPSNWGVFVIPGASGITPEFMLKRREGWGWVGPPQLSTGHPTT